MVVVTLADLVYRYRQFLIAVVGAGVVMAMALLMSGLVGGFTAETTQTISGVGADHWVLTTSSAGRVAAVGVFPQSTLAALARTPGVSRVAPVVILPQEVAHVNGNLQTIVVVGAQPGQMGSPTPTSGQPVTGSGQVVASTKSGATVGGTMEIGTNTYRVVGLITDRTLLGGVPVVYTTLRDAQSLGLGGRPLITGAVTIGSPATVPVGLQALTTSVVEARTLDALASGISSINNSKILMWFISGIIIAALLYVSALQRVRDFAVLKALGSSTLALLGSLALQAVIVALLAAAFAAVISNFMGGLFQQPVAIPGNAFVTLPIVAIVVGLLSSLVALRQATGADPAAAFG